MTNEQRLSMDLAYRRRYDATLEHMVRYEFPFIKELSVNDGVIKFEDDGIHTEEMVREFINEMVDAGKSINASQSSNTPRN